MVSAQVETGLCIVLTRSRFFRSIPFLVSIRCNNASWYASALLRDDSLSVLVFLRTTGEYTGMVQREVLMKQQENNRMCTTGSPPEGYNYTYAGGCKKNTTQKQLANLIVVLAACWMSQYQHPIMLLHVGQMKNWAWMVIMLVTSCATSTIFAPMS
eukprot:COSAG02_NODE_5064_length_4677_cov_1.407820_3_plen_156_part_00